MQTVILDHIDLIELNADQIQQYHNELALLDAWYHGIEFLYQQLRPAETFVWNSIANRSKSPPAAPPKIVFNNLSCAFQWYAVTLCNFVDLIGHIGWETTKSVSPQSYVKAVIPAVLVYRNLVGAHPARIRPNKSNAAERFASLMPPSTMMQARYHAGAWAISVKQSGNRSDSTKLREWSLTSTHEALAPRYWPNASLQLS